MPYIADKGRRKALDVIVREMEYAGVKADGDLNYILYKFAKYHVGHSYNDLKNFRGELEETRAEIKRRILEPLEDKKIEENGDI
jgi:hypothetical protein